jgi:dipeptidyl aminopeptidase/acylaminoacyl peptidase
MPEPRTLTLDDLFAIEHVSDVQVSPDGRLVAYVAGKDHAAGEYHTPAASIWLVPSDGSAPARRLTFGPHADMMPRWSPDGTQIAFLSDREKADTPQVYIIPLVGGEARQLTHAKAGVAELKWSPDGARIAYVATEPESEEQEKRKKERDDRVVVDRDYHFARLWVIAAAGGESTAITPAEYQVRAFAWYRDGWALVTSPTPKEDDFMLPWTVRYVRQGDTAAETLWEGKYAIDVLAASRDGQSLGWLHGGALGEESADELWVIERDGAPRLAAADYSGGMMWMGWLPDGDSLLVSAAAGTRVALGRLDVASGTFETLFSDRTIHYFLTPPVASVSADGRTLACVLSEGDRPAEVWVGALGGELKQITDANPGLREVALGKAETIRWRAPDGLEIEGVLVYPVGYQEGTRYPLVVQIHGGPTGAWSESFIVAAWHDWAQPLAARGYAVLMPNPRGSAGRGREFAWGNRRRWGIGDLDDVLSGVDALVARGLADPERLGVGGWSYGGYLTSWTIGHTNRFKAAVVGAGVTDLLSFQAADIPSWLPGQMMLARPWEDQQIYLQLSPITYVGDVTTPTLIPHGEADERVPLGQGKELYAALRARGVPVEMVIYPREGHLIWELAHQRDLLERVVEWYDRWLKHSE